MSEPGPGPATPVVPDLDAPVAPAAVEERRGRAADLARRALVPFLSILTAFIFGALVIVFSDQYNLKLLLSDPAAAAQRAIAQVVNAYSALLTGALGNPGQIVDAIGSGDTKVMARAFVPISETVLNSTPLIFTASVALGFGPGLQHRREGQPSMTGPLRTFAASPSPAPDLHPPSAGDPCRLRGGLWGFIPGPPRPDGAHEG